MKRCEIQLSPNKWSEYKVDFDTFVMLRGTVYFNSERLNDEEWASLLSDKSFDELKSILSQLNGFYSLIVLQKERVLVAVDHIRSFPLFYGTSDKFFFVSDKAEWVRNRINDQVMSPEAYEEFLLAGYVTGEETLYPSVKQLQAGEVIESVESLGKVEIKAQRFYRFWHHEPESFDEHKLSLNLDGILLKAMKRLVERAAGRQLVIPLSGGFDSRLIVALLKRLDYSNVICFTYGVSGNREAEFSRRVAESLGFSWVFVEYSEATWKREWGSSEGRLYQSFASNLSSLPHIQDWLAIKKLVEDKVISADAIVVPGHSGDFVAGSHIPNFVFENNEHSEDSLYEELINKHFSNAPKNTLSYLNNNKLRDRLSTRLVKPFDGSSISYANILECWDWQERQSKYIVNSVRVYEQFGLEWWLPLWDKEFVQFWETVPLTLRKDRKWFKEYIERLYSKYSSSAQRVLGNGAAPTKLRMFLIFFGKKILPKSLREKVKKRELTRKSVKHTLAFEGLITEQGSKVLLREGYSLIGIYSKLYLDSSW